MGQLFIESRAFAPQFAITPGQERAVIEPLSAFVFGSQTESRSRQIDKINISGDRMRPEDPASGPTAVAALFKIREGVTPLIINHAESADLMAIQKTSATGLVTAEWHTTPSLDASEGVCGGDNCVRMEYADGELDVQSITGESITLADARVGYTALRFVMENFKGSGMAYDPQWTWAKEVAQRMGKLGHQLTIPDAEQVSGIVGLPYEPR